MEGGGAPGAPPLPEDFYTDNGWWGGRHVFFSGSATSEVHDPVNELSPTMFISDPSEAQWGHTERTGQSKDG